MKPLFGADSSIAKPRRPVADPPATAAVTNGGPPHELAPVATAHDLTSAHPEVYVAAAFAAGVVLAIFARRLGR